MEQINQLKKMRDEALGRLQFNPDYKLLISLDRLIREIEQLLNDPSKHASSSVTSTSSSSHSSDTKKAASDIDAAFDKIANDLKEEVEGSKSDDVNSDIKAAMSGNGSSSQASAAAK
ncbi:MAG: hypothetical protein JJ891_17385 [Rhizobiaceae bacterium]|nr:hypothetical protein [Rhizobiaceae bacterium]